MGRHPVTATRLAARRARARREAVEAAAADTRAVLDAHVFPAWLHEVSTEFLLDRTGLLALLADEIGEPRPSLLDVEAARHARAAHRRYRAARGERK